MEWDVPNLEYPNLGWKSGKPTLSDSHLKGECELGMCKLREGVGLRWAQETAGAGVLGWEQHGIFEREKCSNPGTQWTRGRFYNGRLPVKSVGTHLGASGSIPSADEMSEKKHDSTSKRFHFRRCGGQR